MYTPFWKKGQRSFSYPTRQCIVLTLNSFLIEYFNYIIMCTTSILAVPRKIYCTESQIFLLTECAMSTESLDKVSDVL